MQVNYWRTFTAAQPLWCRNCKTFRQIYLQLLTHKWCYPSPLPQYQHCCKFAGQCFPCTHGEVSSLLGHDAVSCIRWRVAPNLSKDHYAHIFGVKQSRRCRRLDREMETPRRGHSATSQKSWSSAAPLLEPFVTRLFNYRYVHHDFK